MAKRRGKGRIPNRLVAASCAAVLAVYTAGYWRTREAARQFETQAKARRAAVRSQRTAAIKPAPAFIQPPPALPQVQTQPPVQVVSAVMAAEHRSSERAARKKSHVPTPPSAKSTMTVAATSSATDGATGNGSAPASAATGIVVAPIAMPPEPPPVVRSESKPAATPAAKWRDGTYYGHGDSPHGDLNVKVVIKAGRIVEASVDVCNTRYRCELLDPLVDESIEIQNSIVDYVSHATESSDAYRDGLVEALNQAVYSPTDKDTPAS